MTGTGSTTAGSVGADGSGSLDRSVSSAVGSTKVPVTGTAASAGGTAGIHSASSSNTKSARSYCVRVMCTKRCGIDAAISSDERCRRLA